jgi:Cu/Ag efflux protein CusF
MKRYFLFLAATSLVIGCVFLPRRAFPHEEVTTTVQFDREIVRILDDHCVMCHVDNGPAFPMVTYEQTYAVRRIMRMDVLNRRMAPWAAVPGNGDFINTNGLTLREIAFIVAWAEGWGPRNNGEVYAGVGDATTKPKVIQAQIDFGRWELGKPDLLLPLSANTIEPQQKDEIKRTVIDPKLTSDRWLRGLEYKPGDRRVVHAVFFTVQETGQWIGSWTPWYGFVSLPKEIAYRLPSGSHIVAEIHYYGAKDQVVEQGSLGLYFADQPSSRVVSDLVLDAKDKAPAAAGSQDFSFATKLAADTNLLALRPDVRPGVQSVEVSAKTPDGVTQVLLFAKDFPMEWPTPYIFRRPVALPKGTELSVSEHYDAGASIPAAGIPVTLSGFQGAALPPVQVKTQEAATTETPTQHFKLAGTVKSVDAEGGSLTVQHGEIPGFMGAMTMSYRAGRQEDLKKVSAGDQIQSDVVVDDTGTHLENIKVTGHTN